MNTTDQTRQADSPKELEFDPLLFSAKYILDFYFGEIAYDTILSLAPKSEEGFNEDSFLDVVTSVGLMAIERNMRADEIPAYFMPSLLFDSSGHPMILLRKTGKKALLLDPSTQLESEVPEKALRQYKKVILVFRDAIKQELLDKSRSKKWFWNPVKSFWRSYIEIGILTIFINIFALAVPLFTMSVYDRVVPNNAYETLFVLAFGVGIILTFELVFKSVRNHIIERIGKKLGMFLEEELMKRMLLVQSSFDSMMTGMKANLFRELNQVRDFIATKSIVQFIDIPFFFISMLVIFLISPVVAMVPITMAFLILAFNYFMQIPISNLSQKNIDNMQSKHSYLVETIQGSESIKLANATPTKLFNWRNIVAFTDSVALKIQSLNALSLNVSQTAIQTVTLLVIVVGVFEIGAKELTVGGLIAVTILSGKAMVPIVNLSMMLIRFKEIGESLNMLNDFWHLPIENQKQVEIGLGRLKGDIEFKEVNFFFKDSKYASVDNINLRIKPGERVGIIGQTGAGKSTILKMLVGLHEPTKGAIYLDGHDITTIHPVEIRQNIGVMLQEPFLFNASLKENIELGSPISKERMMEVINITGLNEFVKKSGKGESLQVGERGSNLSVGQRHLVALARAILNDPSILILDEPTTGLDVGLEKTLIERLKTVSDGKTLIVITHRFPALELVDRVIVMSQGKIVADGEKKKVLSALNIKQQGQN